MKKTLFIFASLAAVSSGSAMAAEVTIDDSITLSGLQDTSHPYHAYLQTVEGKDYLGLPPDSEGNQLSICNENNDQLGIRLAAAMLVNADGDACSSSVDMKDSLLTGYLYGGFIKDGNGNVEDNEVVISGSELVSVRAGQISGASNGNVSGNSITISNSTVTKTVYGAYHSGTSGDVTGNSTTISNSTVSNVVNGVYYSGTSGDVTGNSTTISDNTVSNTVYGVYYSGTSGDVTGNSTTISNSTVSYAAYGAYHSGDSGEVAENSLTLRNSSVEEFVYGARFIGKSGMVRDNCLTIENSNITKSSSNIYAGQLGYKGQGEGNITGNILTIRNSNVGNLSAGYHRGSSGNVEDNHVIMENSTQSNANGENKVIAGYIYLAGTSGNITGNTVTLINSSVLGVEAARHQGASGDVTGNMVTMDNSQARSAEVVFLGRIASDDVSDNHLIMQGNSVVSGDACVVSLADNSSTTTAKNVSGNSITLRDTANAGSLYAYYEGRGHVEAADSNYLIIDESWTGTGNETTSFAEDSLNKVIHFDGLSIGWDEPGRELAIAELSSNAANDGPLTIRLNAVDTILKVGSLNNDTNKDIVVEGSGNVRDALGEGAELRQGLEKMAAAVQVEDQNSTEEEPSYTPVPAASVRVEEGLLYGAASADMDAEGNVVEDSVVETSNAVNDSLINITASRQLACRTMLSELTRRLRELRTMPGAENSCWARATAGSEKYALPGSDYRRNGVECGTDRRFGDGRYVAGLAVGYADTKASFGNGRADEQLYTLGTYAGWQGKRGQYVDFVAKYTRFDTAFDLYSANGALNSGDADTWGAMFSLDYGWRIGEENGGFYAEPFVGLMYGFLDGADFTTSRGVSVREDYTDSFVGRVGVTVGYIFDENRATVYARTALNHDWTSESEVHLNTNGNSRSYREDLSGSYGEWAVGGTYRLGEHTWVFGEFQVMGGARVRQPWQLNIGTSFGF